MSNTARQPQRTPATRPGARPHAAKPVAPKPVAAPSRPAETKLETGAAEALRRSDFKLAIKLFKQLLKQDPPRPELRHALYEAYAGRARALAAKGMFEEAETALAKAAADGGNPDPLLYVQCLIKRGKLQRAAEMAVSEAGQVTDPALAELAAALWLAAPFPLAPADGDAEAGRWAAHALAARDGLAAWIDGRPPPEVEELVSRIPLRSAFRAVRLILKAVMTARDDAARARELLAGITPGSPFASLRFAAEAALPPLAEPAEPPTPAQQLFAAEVLQLPAAVAELAAQWTRAERSGPAALLTLLASRKGSLPAADLKRACIELLPAAADHLRKYESAFGPLPQFDGNRVLALAAEARGKWDQAEARWTVAARNAAASGGETARLSAGVIYRHLARLAREHAEIAGIGRRASPEIQYLALSLDADPGHLPAVLQLLDRYRDGGKEEDWHRLAAEAAERFPAENAVLLQAMESATAREDYETAAALARRLLALDPINQTARQRMIDVAVSHARKHMRAGRADLAWRELAAAAEWEQAPRFLLAINRGLVGRELGEADAGALLRRGVELAGGGVAGWFRAYLEHALMGGRAAGSAIARGDLGRAVNAAPPDKDGIAAIAAAVTGADARGSEAVSGLVLRIRKWLAKGSGLPWSAAEFHGVAAMFVRAGAWDLMDAYAKAGRRRAGRDVSEVQAFRFYELVAGAKGSPDALSERTMDELIDLEEAAAERDDFHMANRITRFLEGTGEGRPQHPDDDEDDAMSVAIKMALATVTPDMVLDLLDTRGPRQTAAAVFETMRKGTGGLIPQPFLRDLAKSLVNDVIAELRGGNHG